MAYLGELNGNCYDTAVQHL